MENDDQFAKAQWMVYRLVSDVRWAKICAKDAETDEEQEQWLELYREIFKEYNEWINQLKPRF